MNIISCAHGDVHTSDFARSYHGGDRNHPEAKDLHIQHHITHRI